MNYKRTSAVRLSEFGDFNTTTNRRSRVDASGRSFIPRPSERVSGVQPLEGVSAPGFVVPPRHRSADAGRHTQQYVRPRAESAQRPSSQSRPHSTYMMPRETPSQSRTPLARALLQTPMSAAVRRSNPRTPSSGRGRGRYPLLEKAILALPVKDTRPISDVHWQRKTSEHVVQYLISHPVASQLMPNVSAPLRPVTIKLFVSLVNCLLELRNHMSTTNYIEKLPMVAKRILYPGVMTKSWLKSVNAMHTYPNMLAFLAYMVDFSKIRDGLIDKMDIKRICGVEKHGQWIQLQHKYYLECWDIFQDQIDPDFSSILDEYIKDYREFYELSPKGVKMLNENKARLLHELDLIANAKNREADLKAKLPIIEEKTRQLSHDCSELEKKYKRKNIENSQARVTVNTARDHIKNLEEEIVELHKCIENQSMSKKQRDKFKEKTEEILIAAENKMELINDMQKMSYMRDLESQQMQRQALTACNNMNKVLVAVGLLAGVNLNEYTLEEKDLLAGTALKETRTTLNEKLNTIKIHGDERLQAARNNRETGVCRKQQIVIQLESERQRMQTLQDELNALEERSNQIKNVAVEKLAKQRNVLQTARQRTVERRRRVTQMSTEGTKELEFWQQQNEKWQQKIEQLRSEEELVRKTCESRAKLLIGQYINIAKTIKD